MYGVIIIPLSTEELVRDYVEKEQQLARSKAENQKMVSLMTCSCKL